MLKSILTGYIDMALARAEYDKLRMGPFPAEFLDIKESSPSAKHCVNVRTSCSPHLRTGFLLA